MTVTYLGEIDGDRKAQNRLGVRSYTRAFKLESDDKTDSAYDVGSNASLPVIGSTYADDTQAYCQTLSVDNTDPWKGWTVTAEYSTERTIDSTDPANDEVLVSFTSEIYQAPVFADTSGNAILNSAGDYFIDPVPHRDISDFIAKVRANVQSVPTWVLSKQNNVNSGQITVGGLVIAAGKAKLQRIEIGERQRRNDIDFYQLSFELHCREGGWLLEPLDAGFREIESGALVQIKNAGDEEEPNSPVPLDGSGVSLAAPTPSTAVFGSFTVYTTSDLTTLPGIT